MASSIVLPIQPEPSAPASVGNVLISVVLAAKDPSPAMVNRCLSSFAALEASTKLQVVLVLAGKLPAVDPTICDAFASFQVIQAEPRGVYAAYNTGIDSARGRYTLFFGIDDIALPGMDKAVAMLERCTYDLFAAACWMQGRGLRVPSMNRRALIRENWCQQGLFYATNVLREHRFDLRYSTQADHKLNIDLIAAPSTRLGVQSEPVAYFSAGGMSSQRHDLNFIRDFPTIVGTAYGRRTGLYWAWRQKLSILVRGPLERRYQNPES